MVLNIKNIKNIKNIFSHAREAKEGISEEKKIVEKEIFIFPQEASVSPNVIGNWPIMVLSSSGICYISWHMPRDFTVLEEAKVLIIPDTTETITFDLEVSIAEVGENYDAVSVAALNQTQDVTIKQLTEIDIKDLLNLGAGTAKIKEGDYLSLNFASDTSNIRVAGLRIVYK